MANDDLSYLNGVLSSSSSNAGSSASSANPPYHPESLQPILDVLRISASSEDELANLDEQSVALLLEKLEKADMASEEMEKRLDSLLGQLDGMLETLEDNTNHAGTAHPATEGQEKNGASDVPAQSPSSN